MCLIVEVVLREMWSDMNYKKLLKDEWALLTGLVMIVVAWLTLDAMRQETRSIVTLLLDTLSISNHNLVIIIAGVIIFMLLGQNLVKRLNGK